MDDSAFAYGRETFRAAHPEKASPKISYSLKYPGAIKTHLETTLHAKSVYLLISKSLATQTDALALLEQSLGTKLVGKWIGMKPHTLFSELSAILDDVRPLQPDCLLTVGAGSLTDAGKILCWALANDVHGVSQLESLSASTTGSKLRTCTRNLKAPTIRQIAVPTTLSGGEYTSFAGATEDASKFKHLFAPPIQNPAMVVLDPQITTTTPDRVWLSTGVRAIDHCVETVCSLHSTPQADEVAIDALRILVPALLRCKADPADLDARFQAQMGALNAIRAASLGIPMGGSHAIGHQLGPWGVGHGETSCVCLPAVCKFNAARGANVERQEILASALLKIDAVRLLMEGRGGAAGLGDILAEIIHALGLLRTLGDVGLGRDLVDTLALNTTRDKWAATNPVPLTEKDTVLEVFAMMLDLDEKPQL